MEDTKRRRVTWFHRHVANPTMRRVAGYLPGQAVLETVGRHSGVPRRTPIGGRVLDSSFWMVGPRSGIELRPKYRSETTGPPAASRPMEDRYGEPAAR